MDWIQLELRKASNLRKEVDQAIEILNEAVESRDTRRIEGLKRAFEQRIDELEAFYIDHDDDERAVLFEKQRLRLKRSLQSIPPTAQGSSNSGSEGRRRGYESQSSSAGRNVPPSFGHYEFDQSATLNFSSYSPQPEGNTTDPSPSRPDPQMESPFNDVISPIRTGSFTQQQQQPSHHQSSSSHIPSQFQQQSHQQQQQSQQAPLSPRSVDTVSTRMSEVRRKKRSSKPLYMWEVQDQRVEEAVERQRITSEHGTFLPTTLNGFYQKSPYLNAPETHIDFQVVLTREEFETLVSRRRQVKAEALHASRFRSKKDKKEVFLTSSSPYVEPDRLTENLYRPPQQDKWVGEADFKV